MVVQWWTPDTAVRPPLFSSKEARTHLLAPHSALPRWMLPILTFLQTPIDPRPFSPLNPHFVPLPNTKPLPVYAALLPPIAYLTALSLLPPFDYVQRRLLRNLLVVLRFAFAVTSIYSFAILPFAYHVPGSAILTYQLGLIGCFGACRAFDIFFLSFPRVPRRISWGTAANAEEKKKKQEPSGQVYDNRLINEQWPTKPHPRGVAARTWWAIDLMISMRGVGWDFASPDVRHDSNPWQPPSSRQIRRALFKLAPTLIVTLSLLRSMNGYIGQRSTSSLDAGISQLPFGLRPVYVTCTGISLYVLFDFGYTLLSAMALPLLHSSTSFIQTGSPYKENEVMSSMHNVDFFPLLNPLGLQAIRSVRSFWSKAWHRLFHRAFLIYGIIPFRNAALRIEYAVACLDAARQSKPKPPHPFEATPSGKPTPSKYADPGRALCKNEGDWGKVLGAFVASGVIHAISERAALGGRVALPHMQSHSTSLHLIPSSFSGVGELSFFILNGVAVIVETAVGRAVLAYRRRKTQSDQQTERWYDVYVQIAWTLTVLLTTGELFTEGWITSGLLDEITFRSA